MSNLTPRDDTHPLPLPLARHVDEVCCRFEAAWKAVASGGSPPRLEAYLTEVAEPAHAVLLRELLKVEAHHRRPTPEGSERSTEPMTWFLKSLRRSELLDAQQEQTVIGETGETGQPEELAAQLVARGWLTAYQAGRLLAGRPEELILGNYRLLEPLGEGGMGQVFKARHPLMNRLVAVKVIRPDVVNDPGTARRFRVEIQAAAQLNHPNVVVAHDAEEAGGRHFLVMELCEGVTLRRLVEQAGPLPVETACEYVRQAALGLQHAFERGLIHRDVKPDNLVLCGTTVKILDFGLARLRPDGDTPVGPATRVGTLLGTPDFMAPEQAEGRADVRSDLYSLGCTFYFLLTGQAPFPGGSLIEKCLRHRSEAPEPVGRQRPDVPAPVQEIVHWLMAKKPDDRFQTPTEVAIALAPFARVRPMPATLQRTDGGVPALPTPPEPKNGVRTVVETNVSLPDAAKAGVAQRSPIRRRVAATLGAVLAVALVSTVVFLATRNWSNSGPAGHGQPAPPRRIWQKSRTLPFPEGHAATYGLAFSPDSRLLAAASGNNEDRSPLRPGRLQVWDVAAGRLAIDREVEEGPATCVAFSPNGKRLAWGAASWSHDAPGHVTLLGVEDQSVKATLKVHTRGVVGLAFQPKGNLLVSSGREGKVILWDGEWGAQQAELKEAKVPVLALAFSPDGERLAVGSDDGSVDLWEVSTRQSLGALASTPWKPVRGLAFSADGQTILGVTKLGEGLTADLLRWNSSDRKPAPAIPLGETEAYCLAISPDRATLAVGCLDKTARLYQIATCQELQTLEGDYPVLCAAFSPDGRYLATSGGWFGPVQLWEKTE